MHDFRLRKNVRLQVGGLVKISRSYLDLDHIECGKLFASRNISRRMLILRHEIRIYIKVHHK
jgi:hypothetical protein